MTVHDLMADSVNAAQLPIEWPAYAGYVNGLYANYASIVKRFPKAQHLSITVNAEAFADCLDVENGDATPSQVAGWVAFAKAHGIDRPCIYASLASMPAVKANLAGIPRSEYRLWVAAWDGIDTGVSLLSQGYDACQYANGQAYDSSVLLPAFFGSVKTPAKVKPSGQIDVWVGHRLDTEEWAARKDTHRDGIAPPVLNPKGGWRTRIVQINTKTGAVRLRRAALRR